MRFRADDPGVLADAVFFLGVRLGVLGAALAFLAGEGLATLSVSASSAASSFLVADRVLFLPVLAVVLAAPLSASPAEAAAASDDDDDVGLNAKAEKSGRGRPDPFIVLPFLLSLL